jgi:aminopeptidase N
VLFYHLDIQVFPETKSIIGSNTIRFNAVDDFSEMQVDLFANMKINKILFHDRELNYTREADAVFIKYPTLIKQGTIEEIKIFYEGNPQLLNLNNSSSGLIWYQDKNGKPWIETVSQGSGASVWWPCKDHLSDKADSMRISVTIPKGLTEISNGKLLSRKELPDNYTKFDWFVSYPMNNYNAVVYIGDYTQFSDQYINNNDTLQINYYTLSYTKEKAKDFFKQVKPMINLFEKSFGPYPFKKDAFSLVEAPYGMEHQGAVSMGSIYNLPNFTKYDSAALTNMLWHETAHEWWGNSVTCKDYADFWIHESFATYAEILARKTFVGDQEAKTYINNWKPDNKEPIIGFPDVNDFHMGDMYSKGCRMLITLQNIIQNDSLLFNILHTIQEKYKYQTVTTKDIVDIINNTTKTDYNYFFDQYLKYPSIPELLITYTNVGSSFTVEYKWKAEVTEFKMPVQVTKLKNSFTKIYPTTEWQTMVLNNMKKKDFKVNRETGYFNVSVTKKTTQ